MLTTYQLAPNDSLVDFADIVEMEDWEKRTAHFRPDPLNSETFTFPKDEEIPEDKEHIVSVLALPSAPPQPWSTPREGVPTGRVEMHRLRSTILDNERRVWVYTPPGYTNDGEPYGLLLVFDGLAYIELVPTPTILDNLLHEGKIPPLVAVIPDSLNQETRSRELPCYQPFVDYLTRELMPWVHEHYHVTSNPAQSVVGGSSFGGLGAAFVGLKAADTFGNVLSQSGSFWWRPDWKNPDNEAEFEWLAQQYMEQPKLPVRFYLDVGLLEHDAGKPGEPSQLLANRHMRDILRTKGYEVHYAEYNGGHEYLCWSGTLADGLLALIGS
jgi:enterochelin esterase family protein